MGMKVNYKTKVNDFPNMIKRLKAIDGTGVDVGVLNGEHKWLASIHEYGCDIAVTDKMRVFLHSQGLHLKATTTHIHIPERSFLRTGYDKNAGKVKQKINQMLADVASGKMSESTLYEAAGVELAGAIKNYAVELSAPPDHPFTVDRKGSSNPLVDNGDMIGGITWRKAK